MLCLASHKKALTYYIMLFIAPVNQHAVLMTHHCTTCCIKGTWAVTVSVEKSAAKKKPPGMTQGGKGEAL
jgi:hypothetical protein